MKYFFVQFILQFLMLDSYSQEISNEEIMQETVEIPGNISDWHHTGIRVKKNDLVFLNVYGVISLGLFAGEVNGTGNEDNPFLVVYSRYRDKPHGALLCNNDDELIVAKYKSDLQSNNPLFKCVSELSSSTDGYSINNFFTDDFIGNFFKPKSDEELQLIVNDADYRNNYGSFKVTIIIYRNFFPAVGDVIIYWGGPNSILHSGYITEIDETDKCSISKISSFLVSDCNKNGLGQPLESDANDPNLTCHQWTDWTVYHTDRSNGRLIETHNMLGLSCDWTSHVACNGYTDKGTKIFLSYKAIFGSLFSNCHGYTFLPYSTFFGVHYSAYHYITGYQCGDGVLHDNTDNSDQGMAAEYILSENGYKQVYALDTDGKLRHNAAYDVDKFQLRK